MADSIQIHKYIHTHIYINRGSNILPDIGFFDQDLLIVLVLPPVGNVIS